MDTELAQKLAEIEQKRKELREQEEALREAKAEANEQVQIAKEVLNDVKGKIIEFNRMRKNEKMMNVESLCNWIIDEVQNITGTPTATETEEPKAKGKGGKQNE